MTKIVIGIVVCALEMVIAIVMGTLKLIGLAKDMKTMKH